MRTIEVPRETVYVLGDNLQTSIDSRSFGPVPIDRIKRFVIEDRTPDPKSGVARMGTGRVGR
ncbi:hypothetical protein EON82_26155 [bacterium]|nr:MAG: hypothetical protein EON82_26155 [bacterium]